MTKKKKRISKEKQVVRTNKDVQEAIDSLNDKTNLTILLKKLTRGDFIEYPLSDTLPNVGKNCHELRFYDNGDFWRVIYRIDTDVIILAVMFKKKSKKTPKKEIDKAKQRFKSYDKFKATNNNNK